MLPEKIMQSDLLDILFENRNKMYGAYALRKSYNKTMTSAITITLFVTIVFSVFQFIHHTENKELITQVIIPPDPVLTKVEPVQPKPKTTKPQHAASHVNQVPYTTPKIVSDDYKTDMPMAKELDNKIVGPEKIIGNDNADIVQPPSSPNESAGAINAQPVEIKKEDGPLSIAQVMPEFPGGLEALRKFMLKNLRQPDDLEAGEKIVVMASFIVNKSGQIEAVKILNNGRIDLNKEVMRVINKMPLWKPGIQNGNNVAVYFNLPVTFMSTEAE